MVGPNDVRSSNTNKLQHTGGSNCRLHNGRSPEGHNAVNAEATLTSPPLNNTIKRNPTNKPKLTTFCSPEAQIMESPLVPKRSPPRYGFT